MVDISYLVSMDIRAGLTCAESVLGIYNEHFINKLNANDFLKIVPTAIRDKIKLDKKSKLEL